MSLLLALVTTSDEEHGSTIGTSNTSSTHGDTSSHSLLSACRLLSWTLCVKRIVVSRARVSRAVTAATGRTTIAVQYGTGHDTDRRVNLARQVAHQGISIIIQWRRWVADIISQLGNTLGRIVNHSLRGDVAIALNGVVRLDAVHYNLVYIKPATVRKSLRQKIEHLRSSQGLVYEMLVVFAIEEGNLDECRAFGLLRRFRPRSNCLWQVSRNTRLGSCLGSINSTS